MIFQITHTHLQCTGYCISQKWVHTSHLFTKSLLCKSLYFRV